MPPTPGPASLKETLIPSPELKDEGVSFNPTPTLPPTPVVEAAAVQAQGGSLTEAEMLAVLREAGWPTELHSQALAVAWCESKWSPYAMGDGGVSLGLFQMGIARPGWNGWFRYFGVDESLAYDPVTNATVARLAYAQSGWGPWSCRTAVY